MKTTRHGRRRLPAAAVVVLIAGVGSSAQAEGGVFVGGAGGTELIIELPCDDNGEELPEVRGIMVCLHTGPVECGRVARTLSFAWLYGLNDNRPEHVFEDSFWGIGMLHSIAIAADELGHPELRHAPLAWTGFSDGGGAGLAFAATIPGNGSLGAQSGPTADRFLAIAHNDGSTNVYGPWQVGDPGIDEPLPAELLGVPIFFAERENADYQLAFFEDNRAEGALWGRAAIHTRTEHSDTGEAWPVAFYFLQEVIKGRYPTDPEPESFPDDQLWRSSVPLLSIDEDFGYVVDDTNEVAAQPIAEYVGTDSTHREMSWMPSENLAYAFRAVASWNRLGPIGRLGPEFDYISPGETWQATISVDNGWSDWELLEVFDGAQRLASIRPGSSLDFSFVPTDEDIGVHLFNVVAHRGGDIAVSPPSGLLVEGVAAFPWNPFPGSDDGGGDESGGGETGDDDTGGGEAGDGDDDDSDGGEAGDDRGSEASGDTTSASGSTAGDTDDGSASGEPSGCGCRSGTGVGGVGFAWAVFVLIARRRSRRAQIA